MTFLRNISISSLKIIFLKEFRTFAGTRSASLSAVNVISFILFLHTQFSVSFDLSLRNFSPPPRGSKENQCADLIRRRSRIRSQQWGPPRLTAASHRPRSPPCLSFAFPAFSETKLPSLSHRFHPITEIGHTHRHTRTYILSLRLSLSASSSCPANQTTFRRSFSPRL